MPILQKADFHEIPEALIKNAADVIPGDNAFKQLLFTANKFRQANTVPVFLINNEQTFMLVSCRETWNKRLH